MNKLKNDSVTQGDAQNPPSAAESILKKTGIPLAMFNPRKLQEEYKNRYVTFLDIMGFSELIRRVDEDPSLLENISDALKSVEDLRH